VKIPADVPYIGPPQTAPGALIDLTAKTTTTEPEPATGQQLISFPAHPRQAWPRGGRDDRHIQNNPFGRSTDGHRDDWSAVQIGGTARVSSGPPDYAA
jgi:hypothetical protein